MHGLVHLSFRAALVAIVCLFWITPATATTFVRVTDEDLAAQADLVVEARVVSVAPGDGEAPSLDYQVDVLRTVKGEADADRLSIRVAGGPGLDGWWLKVYGVPELLPGERVMLFLRRDEGDVLRPLHVMQGVFHVSTVGDRDVAWRSFAGALEMPLMGRELRPEAPRDLERFAAWLDAAKDAPSYFRDELDLEELAARRVDGARKFTLLDLNGRPGRWREFDSGGSVRYQADSSGQPGLASGGFGEFQQALQAWTNDTATPIRLVYGGQTTATGGLTTFDGINSILFDNPNDNDSFDEPFSCSSGGTLAIGGPWFNPNGTHTFAGATYVTIGGGDIVTNKGLECWIPFRNRAAQVFAHEVGHTLGLGHSCGDDSSGGCNTAAKNDALMRAFVHNDSRGARLGQDDREAIDFLYGAGVTPTPPTAPADLAATAVPGAVQVTWTDLVVDESTYRVERAQGDTGLLTFLEIAVLGANTTFYQDDAVETGEDYSYRVRAVNSSGGSPFAGPVSVTTLGPAAPDDLNATALSSDAVRLTWDDNSSGETGFEVQVRTGAGAFSTVGIAPPNTQQVDVVDLFPSTTYEFRVRATSDVGTSGFTNIASATTFQGQPSDCVPGPRTACLNGGRFRVEVDWLDFAGQTGDGRVVQVPSSVDADDSGVFWFFSADNWELLVKVLDGCPINDHFWVFLAATTNVGYDLVVTDTATGISRTFSNPLGVASPAVANVEAFPTCSAVQQPAPDALASSSGGSDVVPSVARLAAATSVRSATASATELAARELEALERLLEDAGAVLPTKGGCVESDIAGCLQNDRFEVEISWRDFEGNTGSGRLVPFGSDDSGLFWFFDPNNWEVLVKVLDACGVNDRYWVFAAATTNVQYSLTVTDTATGTPKSYSNPLGTLAPAITDTDAFATCP